MLHHHIGFAILVLVMSVLLAGEAQETMEGKSLKGLCTGISVFFFIIFGGCEGLYLFFN